MSEEEDIIQTDFSDPDFTDESGRDYWEHYRFEVEKGQVLLRIDKYLVERIKGTSRNRIQNAAEAQCIRVNGTPVKSNYRVHPGDLISVVIPSLPAMSVNSMGNCTRGGVTMLMVSITGLMALIMELATGTWSMTMPGL